MAQAHHLGRLPSAAINRVATAGLCRQKGAARHTRTVAQTDGEQERLRARLEAKLQPERIRATLAFAGLYQITNELIENAVVEDVRQFYFRGFDETGFRSCSA